MLAGDAELLKERTFLEVGPPLWIERVGSLSDFDMTPDSGVAGVNQAAPYRLAFRRLFTRLKRKVPSSFCRAWKIAPLHPYCPRMRLDRAGEALTPLRDSSNGAIPRDVHGTRFLPQLD